MLDFSILFRILYAMHFDICMYFSTYFMYIYFWLVLYYTTHKITNRIPLQILTHLLDRSSELHATLRIAAINWHAVLGLRYNKRKKEQWIEHKELRKCQRQTFYSERKSYCLLLLISCSLMFDICFCVRRKARPVYTRSFILSFVRREWTTARGIPHAIALNPLETQFLKDDF